MTNHTKDQNARTSHKTINLLTFLLAVQFSHAWLAFFLQHNNIPEIFPVFTVFPGWEIDARNIVTCRPMQGIPDSLGFWIPGSGFQILCQWKLDFGFQSLVGFRIPWVVFRISKVQDSGFHKQKFHGSRNLDSVTWSKTCVRDRSLFIAGGGRGGRRIWG